MQEKRRLEGAKFVLLDCHKHEVMCVKTDCNGEAFIGNLPYGRYFLVEVEPPCGYMPFDKEMEVCIDHSCPDRCVEVYNRPCKGSLKIVKLST